MSSIEGLEKITAAPDANAIFVTSLEFLKNETFKWLMRSPKKSVSIIDAPNFINSLARGIAKKAGYAKKEDAEQFIEGLREYLTSGALADEEIGITWNSAEQKYELVNPKSSAEKVIVPESEPEPEAVKPSTQAPEKLRDKWDALLEMDPRVRLDALRTVYEHLQTYAIPSSLANENNPDSWYLDEAILKGFPAHVRRDVLENPEIVGYTGEPGTFGGLLIAMNLARKFDSAEKDGAFKDHIKLVDKFRNRKISFSLALKIIQKSLENKKGKVGQLINSLYYDAGLSKTDPSEQELPAGDNESRDLLREKKEGKAFREKVEEAGAKRNKDKPSKRPPLNSALAARRPVRQQVPLNPGAPAGGDRKRAAQSEPDMDHLSRIDFEINRLEERLKEQGVTVTREIALARLQHERAEMKYTADFEAAGSDQEKRVQSLLDYVDTNLSIAFTLEAARARTESEGNVAMVKAIDKGVLNQQYQIFVGALSDIEKALKTKDLRPELMRKLQEAKTSISGSMAQYTIEGGLPAEKIEQGMPLLPAKEARALLLETTATATSLEQAPSQRLRNALTVLSELLERPTTGDIAETAETAASTAAEITRVLDALNQMKREGLVIDIPQQELARLNLVARRKELPSDRGPILSTLGKIKDFVGTHGA